MKKIISLTLALMLILSMSTIAFAAEQSDSHDVTARYEKTENEEAIYNVDIAWGELTFTYSEHTEKTWNPATHTYDEDVTGGWDKTEASVTVTNHSNVEVTVAMALTPVEGTGVEVSLTGGNGTLARSTVGSAAFCRATDGGDTHQVHEIGHELFAVLLQPAADLAVIHFVDHKKPPVSGGIGWMIAQNGKFCYRFLKKINNTRCRRRERSENRCAAAAAASRPDRCGRRHS